MMEDYEIRDKNVNDVVPYTLDWSDMVATADIITLSLWVIPSNTTDGIGNTEINVDTSIAPNYGASPTPQYSLGGTSISDKTTTVKLKGGTLNKAVTIENRITTSSGSKFVRRFILRFVE